jgi:hypothetical protein
MLFPDDTGLIARGIEAFNTTTGVNGFSLEDFESKAMRYNEQYPGEGFQRAYEDSLNQIFKTYVDEIALGKVPNVKLADLVYSFDSFIVNPYLHGAEKHGIDAKIEINLTKLNPKTVESFAEILEATPNNPVLQDTYRKFESKELTLDSVYKDVTARKNTVPTRKEARELVARAVFLREKQKSRTGWEAFKNLFTVIKEYFAIEALKSLAEKAGDLDQLDREAELGEPHLYALKREVDRQLINLGAERENERILQKIKEQTDLENVLDSDGPDEHEIESEINFDKLDEGEVSTDFEELGKKENELDANSDLSQIDDAFSLDDDNEPVSDAQDLNRMKIVIEEISEKEGILPKFEEEEKSLSEDSISLM